MSAEKLTFRLAVAGLNLLSVLDARKSGVTGIADNMKSLLLIGNSGPTLWQVMPANYLQRQHPVDEYTAETLQQLFPAELPDVHWQVLFPALADAHVPNLQQLGQLAGWHHPSPLGNGINRLCGLWFAYRAVVVVDRWLPPSKPLVGDSPCLSCVNTPCIAACPASALVVGQIPRLVACVKYRSEPRSACAQTCLARLACPVATECRYTEDQTSYFYQRSLPSLQQWVADDSASAD